MILNGRKLVEILPLSDLYNTYGEHHRLTVFVNKGRKCVVCGREGWLLLVTEGDRLHVDLYTDDFILMTVDHIVPKSIAKQMGWTKAQTESLDNKQPMCDPCNNKKGNKTLSNDELRERRPKHRKRAKGPEIIRQLVYNNNVFNRELK